MAEGKTKNLLIVKLYFTFCFLPWFIYIYIYIYIYIHAKSGAINLRS